MMSTSVCVVSVHMYVCVCVCVCVLLHPFLSMWEAGGMDDFLSAYNGRLWRGRWRRMPRLTITLHARRRRKFSTHSSVSVLLYTDRDGVVVGEGEGEVKKESGARA